MRSVSLYNYVGGLLRRQLLWLPYWGWAVAEPKCWHAQAACQTTDLQLLAATRLRLRRPVSRPQRLAAEAGRRGWPPTDKTELHLLHLFRRSPRVSSGMQTSNLPLCCRDWCSQASYGGIWPLR